MNGRAVEPVRLPRDELAHPHDMEWWYFVAHVRAVETGDRMSILMSAIRRNFGANFTVCLLKVTDHEYGAWPLVECGQLFAPRYFETTSPVSFRFIYNRSFANAYTCGDGSWAINGVPGRYEIVGRVGGEERPINLTFTGTHPAQLLHADGIMEYGHDHRLAYYVRPKIRVTGDMWIRDRARAVVGDGWYERQWGPWPKQPFAWKYLNIHLDDNEQWLLFRAQLGDVHTRYAACFPAAGGIREYAPEPHSVSDFMLGNRPSGTHVALDVEDGPLELTIRPLFPNEPELDSRYPEVPRFWESVSRVEGKRGGLQVKGFAMTELHSSV